jgi:hypothetical protein
MAYGLLAACAASSPRHDVPGVTYSPDRQSLIARRHRGLRVTALACIRLARCAPALAWIAIARRQRRPPEHMYPAG